MAASLRAISYCAVSALGFLVAACSESPEPAEEALAEGWNLVLVTLDTTRPDFLTPYGAGPEATPRLQELAESATVFTNAFSETNVTNPSHVSIFSGLRAVDHGVTGNTSALPEEVDTLPEAFQRAGYATGGFPAAAHLVKPLHLRGFDTQPVSNPPPNAKNVSILAREWIAKHKAQPFFAWVHFFDAHMPYTPPPWIAKSVYAGNPADGSGPLLTDHEYFQRDDHYIQGVTSWLSGVRDPLYPEALYAGELRNIDRHLGMLFDVLENEGLLERTVVLVIADHGESLGEHGIFYAHRGIYEEPLRIPFLLRVPGMPAGRADEFVTTLDVVPTIRDLFGIAPDEVPAGTSLLPLMRGEEAPHFSSDTEVTFVHQNANNRAVAVRHRGWKLIWPIGEPVWPFLGGPELFDLNTDPDELIDVFEANPERVAELRALGAHWIDRGVDEMDAGISDEALQNLRDLGYLDD